MINYEPTEFVKLTSSAGNVLKYFFDIMIYMDMKFK